MPPYIREYVFENVGLDDRTQSVCVPTGRLPSASYSAPARPPPTMGKCGTRDAEAMKLAMCEDLRTAGISHLREDHDEMEKTPVPAATAVRRPDAGDDDDTRTLKPPCRVHHQEATGRGADERQGNRTLLVNVNSRLNADNELCSIGEVSSKDTSSHNGSTEHLLEDPSQSPPVKDSFQLLAKEELYDSKKPRFFPDNLELSPTNNVLSQIADGGLLNSPTSSTSPVDDVSVIVGPNNRLSTVLENIPLLYIPKTKQLVSHQWSGLIKDNGFVESINQFSNINSSLSDVRYVPMTEKLQFEDEIISIKDDLELDSPVSTLPRTNTSDSLIRTDVSSLSSISTDITGSVASVSDDYHDGRGAVPEGLEAGFIEINLHSRNSYERTKIHSRYCVMDGKEDKSKRKSLGLSGFLAKNLFRKHRDHEESEPGWKLFGRVPPKETTHKNPSQISEEYQAKHRTAQLTTARRARKDIEVMSTTALILENRPGNLPSKAPEEERKHKQEYEAMVEAAKKREQRELKQKKKDLQQQLRHEEQLVAAARCWNSDILPSWDVMKSSKKARDLWWQGLPPSVRGKVWKLAIGNELNITSELYDICLNRAKDKIKALNESVDSHQLSDASEHSSSKEASVELIKLDVSRTFPQLCIFQKVQPTSDRASTPQTDREIRSVSGQLQVRVLETIVNYTVILKNDLKINNTATQTKPLLPWGSVKWGTQEMIDQISPAALRHVASERLKFLARPKKRIQQNSSEPLRPSSWGHHIKQASSHILALAQPKCASESTFRRSYLYSCGRESPIYRPSSSSVKDSARERTVRLSQPRAVHKDFLPSRSVQTVVSKAAIQATPRARVCELAIPKSRSVGLFRSPYWPVSRAALRAEASDRVRALSISKPVSRDYKPPRPLTEPVALAGSRRKQQPVTERLQRLSLHRSRKSMGEVLFRQDAFDVRRSAIRGNIPGRILQLSTPNVR